MRRASLAATSSLWLPPESYVYNIIPINGNTRIAAISSDNSLRIVDPVTLQNFSNGTIPNVHAGVTCLTVVKEDVNGLLTAGRDGLLRHWDIRSRQNALEFRDDSKAAYLSLCSGDTGPVVGTELYQSQASVIQWDSRFPKKPLLQYVESHNDDVTTVQVHPTSPRTLLTGSTDGLVNIFDTTHPLEEDALLQVSNHGSSIAHAGFLSTTQFYALSHDENFSIYQLNAPDGSPVEDFSENAMGDLRGVLGCEYVVDCVPSFGNGQAVLAAGSHSKEQLDLVPIVSSGSGVWDFDVDSTITLPGAHGEEIVRSVVLNNQTNTIHTAGEDGNIKLWRLTDHDPQAQQERDNALFLSSEIPKLESNKKKHKEKKGREGNDVGDGVGGGSSKGRFRPYEVRYLGIGRR